MKTSGLQDHLMKQMDFIQLFGLGWNTFARLEMDKNCNLKLRIRNLKEGFFCGIVPNEKRYRDDTIDFRSFPAE